MHKKVGILASIGDTMSQLLEIPGPEGLRLLAGKDEEVDLAHPEPQDLLTQPLRGQVTSFDQEALDAREGF